MGKSKKQPTFEEAIEQIEQIIDRIESGEIGLEQSMAEYEKGMKLLGDCRQILERAEKRIAELSADAQGRLRVRTKRGSAEDTCADES